MCDGFRREDHISRSQRAPDGPLPRLEAATRRGKPRGSTRRRRLSVLGTWGTAQMPGCDEHLVGSRLTAFFPAYRRSQPWWVVNIVHFSGWTAPGGKTWAVVLLTARL